MTLLNTYEQIADLPNTDRSNTRTSFTCFMFAGLPSHEVTTEKNQPQNAIAGIGVSKAAARIKLFTNGLSVPAQQLSSVGGESKATKDATVPIALKSAKPTNAAKIEVGPA